MNKTAVLRTLSVYFFLVLALQPHAQVVKYWVRFKDKSGTPFSASTPSAFLTQKSIDRRTAYGISIHETDLPVTPAYISEIAKVTNVTVLYASKWLNGVVISIPSASLAAQTLSTIGNYSFVLNSGKVNRYKLNNLLPQELHDLGGKISSENSAGFDYGKSAEQIQQLSVDCLHEQGYRGQGMTIAVCDAGFSLVDSSPVFDSLRTSGRLLGTRDFVSGGTNAFKGGLHGTMVLSCMAATQPGTIMGTAPLANYYLFRTEEGATETISEEYNWIRAAEYADSLGADIITTSLGYTQFDDQSQNHTYADLDGRTAPMSIASNLAARKGIFVLNAAGNEGAGTWHYISVAGDADSICTVGAVDIQGIHAGFSSVGPTADGRIKPDLVACGAGTWVHDGGQTFPGSGTSFATPILAGAVACFWQANKSFNNIKVLNVLKSQASQSQAPDNKMGWGIPKTCSRVARNIPVIIGADVVATGLTGGVAVKILKPLKGPGNFDTVAHPGPYRLNLLYRKSTAAQYTTVAIASKPLLSQLDTILTHEQVNTSAEAGLYAVEFIAASGTIGTTAEAETIFLSSKVSTSKIELSWTVKVPWSNYEYAVYKKAPGETTFQKIGQTNSLKFTDEKNIVAGETNCYKIVSAGQYSDVNIKKQILNSSQEVCTGPQLPPLIPEDPFDFTAHVDPITSILTIRLSRGDHKDIQVRLYDMLGRELFVGEPYKSGTNLVLNGQDLSDYIYFVKVTSSLGAKGTKVAKQ